MQASHHLFLALPLSDRIPLHRVRTYALFPAVGVGEVVLIKTFAPSTFHVDERSLFPWILRPFIHPTGFHRPDPTIPFVLGL